MSVESAVALRETVAEAVIRQAGKKAMDYFQRLDELVVEHKGTQDVVSIADRAAEDLIVGELLKYFPDDRVLGEEGGFRGGSGDFCWVIDPIDGTANFLRGVPVWCVSVALVRGTQVEAGLVYDPNHDDLYTAVRGQGAFRNGRPIRVSGGSDPQKARFGLGFSFRDDKKYLTATIDNLLTAKSEFTRHGSGTLGMCNVADGRTDGYWEKHINSWDVAAGLLLVQEAGGITNDFLAGDGLHKGNEIIAATPGLFDHLSAMSGFGTR